MRWSAFFLLVLVIVGCGPKAKIPDGPLTEMLNGVHGDITFENKKIHQQGADGCTITFHPESGGSSDQVISGLVDEGSYSIKTVEGSTTKIGAPEGNYLVTIVKPSGPARKFAGPINSKYADPKTTDLKATVSEGQNEINFELK
jgi:hypothetical protein